MRTLSTLLSTVLLATLAVSGVAAAAPYDGGQSTPQEDSYYPEHGDPGIDVLHYDLDLTWRRARRTLVGAADITLRATADAAGFQLDLGEPLKAVRVRVDGEPVGATHDGEVLLVDHPVVADQRYLVQIGYRGTPEPVPGPTTRTDVGKIGMNVTRGGQLRTQQEPFGAFTWYPSNDQPSDKALFDLRIRAPKKWVGVSNGTLVSTKHTKKWTTTRFHLAHPVATYLTTLAVGPYAHRTATGPHGLPLNYWLPRGHTQRFMKALRHLPADLKWLESKLGRYPFESAGVVVVPGDSAMETQTLVTFGKKTWRPPPYAREVMVHELAHQWYGDTVTPSDWSDLWMNEGMASYLEARWSVSQMSGSWRAWSSFFRERNRVDRREQGGPGAYDKDMFATGCVYYCTAAMYEALRKKIGDRDFWRLVKRWPQRHRDTNADRDDFIGFAEKLSGQELGSFFDDWLNSPTWPPGD